MELSRPITNALLFLAVTATFVVDGRPPRSVGNVRIDCDRRHLPQKEASRLLDANHPSQAHAKRAKLHVDAACACARRPTARSRRP